MKPSTLPALVAVLLSLTVFAAVEEPKPPTPAEAAESAPPKPQELESVKAAKTNAPAVPPRRIGMVLRGVTLVDTPIGPVLCVPERYMHDLTNVYQSRVVPRLELPE